jgi:leucyl/phenylalanyl-tRNA--protein transferase
LEAYRVGIFLGTRRSTSSLVVARSSLISLTLRSYSLRKTLKDVFKVTFDRVFEDVIAACAAAPRDGQQGTWITKEMQDAYIKLHGLGYAHSVETWLEGELVGGLYGVSLGKAFFGESMFHQKTDASKVALAMLVERLKAWGFRFIDAQMTTGIYLALAPRNFLGEYF